MVLKELSPVVVGNPSDAWLRFITAVAGGEVAGVTFSESQSDTLIGYALSPVALAESIASALNSTEPVSTERCLPR